MPIIKNKIIIILGALLIVGIIAVLIIVSSGGKQGGGVQPVLAPGGTLTMWGVFDDAKTFETAFAAAGARTGITINYVKIDPAVYESSLINALAAGRAPDIFMFHNTWLPKHYDKVIPMPPSFFDMRTFDEQLFPVVVRQDFAPQGTVFALPLSIDTLALFYNKDIFEQTVTTKPPATWNEFLEDVKKMREIDVSGKIIRAGATLGGSAKSVNRAGDILSLLMMQAGTTMVNEKGAAFSQQGQGGDSPGLKSLEFYTQFADPSSQYYTWNDDFSDSIDAFSQGKAAMMLNYGFQIPFIREKNPFLNFSVAQAPQPTNQVKNANYANYWGFAVSKDSRNPVGAWNFIVNLTTNKDIARLYVEETGKPPALLDLISEYQNHPRLGVFTKQILTARSWPQPDSEKVDTIFSEMIEAVLNGRFSGQAAITQAESQITALMGR